MSSIFAKGTTGDMRIGTLTLGSGLATATGNYISTGNNTLDVVAGIDIPTYNFTSNFQVSNKKSFGIYFNQGTVSSINATLPYAPPNGFCIPIMAMQGPIVLVLSNNTHRIYTGAVFKSAGTSATMASGTSAWFVHQSGFWTPFFLQGSLS